MDNFLDLRSDSDDEQRAPRVSNDSGAIDLTNSDDETPAVRGVAATPSSAAMAWVAPPAPAPRITESPVAPRPADDDDDDEDFLAFFSSRRGPAPSPRQTPQPAQAARLRRLLSGYLHSAGIQTRGMDHVQASPEAVEEYLHVLAPHCGENHLCAKVLPTWTEMRHKLCLVNRLKQQQRVDHGVNRSRLGRRVRWQSA